MKFLLLVFIGIFARECDQTDQDALNKLGCQTTTSTGFSWDVMMGLSQKTCDCLLTNFDNLPVCDLKFGMHSIFGAMCPDVPDCRKLMLFRSTGGEADCKRTVLGSKCLAQCKEGATGASVEYTCGEHGLWVPATKGGISCTSKKTMKDSSKNTIKISTNGITIGSNGMFDNPSETNRITIGSNGMFDDPSETNRITIGSNGMFDDPSETNNRITIGSNGMFDDPSETKIKISNNGIAFGSDETTISDEVEAPFFAGVFLYLTLTAGILICCCCLFCYFYFYQRKKKDEQFLPYTQLEEEHQRKLNDGEVYTNYTVPV